MDKSTVVLWKELKQCKTDIWCCNILKEGALEEHLKLAFDDIVPIKFGVNYCCHCGTPVKDGYEKEEAGQEIKKEEWCCRVMRALNFEKLVFTRTGKEVSTLQVSHCFHCGKELKKHSGEGKTQNREKDDKRD